MTSTAAIGLDNTIIDVNHVNLFQHSGALRQTIQALNAQTISREVLKAQRH